MAGGDFNDVVRHVILRIVVDSAGLAEELAAARAKLKGLKDSEGEINKARSKSASEVTKELEKQNKALDDNAKAQEASKRAAQSGGRATAEQTKAETEQIKEQTRQVEARTVAEAKAAQIDSQTRQKELDAQRARSAARKKDADEQVARAAKAAADEETARQKRLRGDADRAAARQRAADAHAAQVVKNEATERAEAIKTDALKSDLASRERQRILNEQAARSNANKKASAEVDRLLADAAKVNEQANAVKAGAVNQRKIARDESSAKVARQDYSTIAGEERRDTSAESQRKRADENAAADRVRLDANAAHARELAELKTTSAVEAAQEAAQERIASKRASDEERLRAQRERNEQSLITQTLKDLETVAEQRRRSAANAETETEKLRELQRKNAYTEDFRAQTIPQSIAANVAKSQSAIEISGAKTDVAQSQAQVAAARAMNEEDKASQSILERKNVLTRNEERFREDIKKVASQTNLIDERAAEVAERRARAAEKAATQRKRASISGGVEGLVGNLVTAASTLAFAGPDDSRLDNSIRSMRKVREETGSARAAVGSFFKMFASGDHEAASVLEHLTARVRNFVKELKPAASGGGNLIGNIFGNIGQISDGFSRAFDGMGRHLFSFQSLIIACIAALGPLAAILGAVGAVALGFASNIGAVAGALLALPGIIGAAVAGFGALAIVLKPLSNVFSAFSAAQKEVVTNTNAARDAANDYKIALINQQQAEIDWKRAQADAPRAVLALADARKNATRQIEDYRDALKKLRYDEEGATEGVLSAEQQARRAMADPTANNLDRRIALHNVQGALFDQQDQAKNARRTRQDASEAFAKGVDGADEVIAANRAVEDSARKIDLAYLQWQKDIAATNKARATKVAGGDAALEYQKQIDKLPPATRKVALAVIDLIKAGGPFTKLRDRLSENIFGPLSKDTSKFTDLLSELGDYLTPASKAMGVLADKVLGLLASPDWKSFFSQSGKSSATILSNLGDAALDVADGFKAIVLAAQPFTEWVTGAIAGVAAEFKGWANSVDKDGKSPITKFLDLTEQRIKEIWPIIKNFAAGFAGFFTALNTPGGSGGEDFTTKFNNGLLQMSVSFRKLGDQAADPNSGFRKWLDHVLPLIGQVGHFLGALGSAFGKLFSDPRNLKEAESLLHNLATKWLPQLAEIFSQLSQSGLISKLAAAIGAVFGAFESFLHHGGLQAFQAFSTTLGIIASAIDFLVKHVPILASVIGAAATVIAIAFGAALINKIAQVIYKFSGLKLLIDGIRNSLNGGIRIPTPGGGSTKPGINGTPAGTAVDGGVSRTEELVVLRRMEIYLRQIAINTGGTGGIADNTSTGPDDDDGKGGKHRKGSKASTAVKDAEEAVEDAAGKGGGKSSWIRKLLGGLGGAVAGDAGSIAVGSVAGGGALSAIGGFFKNLFSSGSRPAASAGVSAASGAAGVAEDVAATAGTGGLVKGLVKGAAGGLGALAASIAAQVGGTALTDHFVKNDKDKASVNKAIGTVASYAGTGALLGNIIPIPGVGAGIGGAVGGAIGGVKALATDPNLRKFLGSKISAGADAVGDFGKSILDSLGKAAGPIGRFFTKTIPDAFHRGIKAITDFFTKTLPKLPGKFFDAFTFGIGVVIGFFEYKIPRAAAAAWRGITTFFTKTLPEVASAALSAVTDFFTVTIPHAASAAWRGITDFFTVTLPSVANAVWNSITAFFTKTLPNAASAAWKGITTFFTDTLPDVFHTVVDSISTFFGTTLPNFFTETLPNAIKSLPGFLLDNLVHPVVDFFSGLGDHIGDAIKGGWDKVKGWAQSLWDRGSKNVDAGRESQNKMSGGLITGVYQGVEDTVRLRATPDEFVMRRSKVMEPGAKAILTDWNEGRLKVDDFYKGLSSTVAPPVMAMVPPEATQLTNRVPMVVNNTVNHAPLMGDVTIHNPIREKSEATLRRQIHIAAIRHRR